MKRSMLYRLALYFRTALENALNLLAILSLLCAHVCVYPRALLPANSISHSCTFVALSHCFFFVCVVLCC
jgi:hypothetical protein